MARNSNGEGGFGDAEEKKLELRLGPPGGEDWLLVKERRDENSAFSLNLFSKTSKNATTTVNSCAGSKRVFMDTVKLQTEGLQLGLGKEPPQKTSARAEQQQHQQSFERKASCPPGAHACSAPSGNSAVSNTRSQTRTASGPVVGWPPIRSFRKNLASGSSKPSVESQNGESEAASKPQSCRKGLFVKINMDGIPIGRKVDLKAYGSYEKLSSAVEELFQGMQSAQGDPAATQNQDNAEQKQAFTGLLDGSGEFILVYEDNEGDRMLVGDVPWNMFVSTAKRLRVLKSSEVSLLSLGGVSGKRTAC